MVAELLLGAGWCRTGSGPQARADGGAAPNPTSKRLGRDLDRPSEDLVKATIMKARFDHQPLAATDLRYCIDPSIVSTDPLDTHDAGLRERQVL